MAFDINKEIGNKKEGSSNRAAWLSGYLTASFRGVKFFIESAENSIGRRYALHEFPERDEPYSEDLGRSDREFAFSAYIIGDNYFDDREALIKALEQSGAGVLEHPYRGRFNAVLLSANIRESSNEGRICRFDLRFREQNIIQLTTSVANTKKLNKDKRDTLIDEIKQAFTDAYDLGSVLVSKAKAVLQALDTGADLLLSAKASISFIAEFEQSISNIKGKLIQIGYDSIDLANTLASAVLFGTDYTSNKYDLTPALARSQYEELNTVVSDMKALSPNTSVTDHETILNNFILQMALTGMCGLISIMEFDSKTDAEKTRAELFSLLNTILLDDNTTDGVFEAIRDMKQAINKDLDSRIATLGELFDYPINDQSIPSLAIAYSVYGALDKEQEILDRNGIQSPFFITGPFPIQVVIDG